MQIKDKINFKAKSKPITLTPENMVVDALNNMCDKNIGSIIVVNTDKTVAGIVTERDMMVRVLKAGIDPNTTAIAQIMTRDIKVAQEQDDLIDWMQTMSNERFRHLPIVDAEGKLINMLSQGDFVAFTWPDLYEKVKQNIKGRLGKSLQLSLILFSIVTLSLIFFNL